MIHPLLISILIDLGYICISTYIELINNVIMSSLQCLWRWFDSWFCSVERWCKWTMALDQLDLDRWEINFESRSEISILLINFKNSMSIMHIFVPSRWYQCQIKWNLKIHIKLLLGISPSFCWSLYYKFIQAPWSSTLQNSMLSNDLRHEEGLKIKNQEAEAYPEGKMRTRWVLSLVGSWEPHG